MATPLTDSINALTAYANEVTGGSDTTLSDAVHTLASGYGGGILDNLLEIVDAVTLNENSYTVTFQCDMKTGMYVMVSKPCGTKSYAAEQPYAETFSMGMFDIRGVSGNVIAAAGQSIWFRRTPATAQETDWWTQKVTLGDGTVTVNPAQYRNYLTAGVTYYLLRVKGV